MTQLILASGSAMRRALLEQAGYRFKVQTSGVDENPIKGESPWDRCVRLARLKALAVSELSSDAYVIGGDQVGALEDESLCELQKCESIESARAQLTRMQGQTHRFLSASAIAHKGHIVAAVEETADVTFRALSTDEIDAYMATGEWQGTCGGYQIENQGAGLVEDLSGSLMAVYGLPLFPLLAALRGLHLAADWQSGAK
jgi:septum formation protein